MRWWSFLVLFFMAACGSETEVKISAPDPKNPGISGPPPSSEIDTTVNFAKDTASYQSLAPAIKKPSGIYQFLFPYDANTNILHTVAFYANTYRLQEEYVAKKDSIVITEGTWAPSQGFIWLYKDQLARGRYVWKGDTLQYFSPRQNKKYSLTKLTPASNNKVWLDKKKGGTVIFAVGTEPFWSVEINKRDSIIVSMPDWTEPLRAKISAVNQQKNETVYQAVTDSLRVSISPYFCSDGMSDFIYSNKVTIHHRGKTYQGCGMKL